MNNDKPYQEFYGGPVKSCSIEEIEQEKTATFIRYFYPNLLAFHPANETYGLDKSGRNGEKLRRMGKVPGVSDWIILEPSGCGRYPGALIELKRRGKSQSAPVSKDQVDFLRAGRDRGYYTAVCYGHEQFELCLKSYIEGRIIEAH